MSLTQMIKTAEMRSLFNQHCCRPAKKLPRLEMVAPPVGERASTLVGTAFDYVVRWRIQQFEYPFDDDEDRWVHSRPWVAGQAIERLFNYNELPEKIFDAIDEKYSKVRRLIDRMVDDGTDPKPNILASVALWLARLDHYYRSGYVDDFLGPIADQSICDLVQLDEAFDPALVLGFEGAKNNGGIAWINPLEARDVWLNPTFGLSPVGGADADLVVDGLLIDIKTTKDATVSADNLRQLIGYATLAKRGGLESFSDLPDGEQLTEYEKCEIDSVGIYFSRFAHLIVWPLDSLFNSAADRQAFEAAFVDAIKVGRDSFPLSIKVK